MSDADVVMLMQRPEFATVNVERFPASMPLLGLLKNDCRIVRCRPGDLIIRDGDYGNSAFLLMKGDMMLVIKPGLPAQVLGRAAMRRRGLFSALSQLWRNHRIPEVRDVRRYEAVRAAAASEAATRLGSLFDARGRDSLFAAPLPRDVGQLAEVPPLAAHFQTAPLRAGAVFGEIAALSRVPRTASIYAQNHATLLEIRWQGLNALRRYDEGWRRIIDEGYRRNQLKVQLQEHPILAGLDETTLQKLADRTLFESYGSFEWNVAYKQQRPHEGNGAPGHEAEPVIAREGDYTDGLLLISGGFARVSMGLGNGRRTLTYLRTGDLYGLDELYSAWSTRQRAPLETTLSAIGYVNLLRIPADVLNELVFPRLRRAEGRLADLAQRPLARDALLEWAVEERLINGTQAMLIDTDKCVRCDDCVRACADTHDGNPRFLRAGRTHGNAMVTHACMHCSDPVCMIGCPTGAIHRTVDGPVVINDDTCIGCGTCANACPYDNIRLVEIRDLAGRPVHDPGTQMPILKATKCDLCSSQPGGPACVRACPHDALSRVDFRDAASMASAMTGARRA